MSKKIITRATSSTQIVTREERFQLQRLERRKRER